MNLQKIAVVLRLLWPAGAPKVAIQEARMLRQMGHQAQLIITRKGAYPYNFRDILREVSFRHIMTGRIQRLVTLMELPTLLLSPRRSHPQYRGNEIIVDPIGWLATAASLSQRRFDVAVCHDQIAGTIGYLAKSLLGTPYVLGVTDPMIILQPGLTESGVNSLRVSAFRPLADFVSSLAGRWENTVLANADQLFAYSARTYRLIHEIYGCRMEIIYPGCNPLPTLPSVRDDFFLSVSRWDTGRNQHTLLEILQRVKTMRLIMAGAWTPASLMRDFQVDARRKGVSNRVSFVPSPNQKELGELYASARAFIHPNPVEGFCMGALEAAAHGCPVIIPHTVGAAELFTHGENCLLVRNVNGFHADLDEFTSHTRFLHENENVARRIGSQAWEVAKSHTWKDHAGRLSEMLSTISEQN